MRTGFPRKLSAGGGAAAGRVCRQRAAPGTGVPTFLLLGGGERRGKGGLFCLISTTNMSAVVDTKKKKNVGSVRLGDNNIC